MNDIINFLFRKENKYKEEQEMKARSFKICAFYHEVNVTLREQWEFKKYLEGSATIAIKI